MRVGKKALPPPADERERGYNILAPQQARPVRKPVARKYGKLSKYIPDDVRSRVAMRFSAQDDQVAQVDVVDQVDVEQRYAQYNAQLGGFSGSGGVDVRPRPDPYADVPPSSAYGQDAYYGAEEEVVEEEKVEESAAYLESTAFLRSERAPPSRFQKLSWKPVKEEQHPLYQTTSSDIGARVPSVHELPMKWHGIKGQFSGAPAGSNAYRTAPLNSSRPRRSYVYERPLHGPSSLYHR